MGATEVLKLLDRSPDLTSTEIAEMLDKSASAVKTILRKLLTDPIENVNRRQLTEEEKINRFGKKLNTKIFVYWID